MVTFRLAEPFLNPLFFHRVIDVSLLGESCERCHTLGWSTSLWITVCPVRVEYSRSHSI